MINGSCRLPVSNSKQHMLTRALSTETVTKTAAIHIIQHLFTQYFTVSKMYIYIKKTQNRSSEGSYSILVCRLLVIYRCTVFFPQIRLLFFFRMINDRKNSRSCPSICSIDCVFFIPSVLDRRHISKKQKKVDE